MSEALLVYTTWPDAPSAEAFARRAVGAELAACANILAPMRSVYRWAGRLEEAQETPMLLKTTRARVEELRAAFLQEHPFETPAFVAWPLDRAASDAAFLAWVETESTGPKAGL